MSSYSFQGSKRIWIPRDEEQNRDIFSARRKETGIKMPEELQPIYLTNGICENGKWGINLLMRLLRLYGAHRCLWETTHEDNKNRKLRKAAIVDITAALGGEITRAQVVQKINVLRATYRYEKRRIKERMRKGIGAKTKLKWFALADSFLRSVPRLENRRNKRLPSDSDSDLDEMVLTLDPAAVMPFDKEFEHLEGNINIKQELESDSDTQEQVADSSLIMSDDPDNSTISTIPNYALSKPKWTSLQSLKFVTILRAQPALWSNETTSNTTTQEAALEHLAKEMDMPIARIIRRVRIFKNTCYEEMRKVCENPNYRPPYVWWPIAESFMSNMIDTVPAANFVDANIVPPATPMDIQFETPATPINPIPSVAPPSTASAELEAELENLFNASDESSNEMSCFERPPSSSISSTTPTKLIWNGLEDDLLEGKWSLKHSVKFLRLYGTHRCLWDLNNADYRSRELRNAAIEDIAAAMGYGLTADYVAKKIKIFRITYMQHRKRMLEAIKAGREPEIQLRWFPLADSFLRPHIGLRSIKEQEREIPQFDYQYVMANLNLIDPELLTDFRGKGTQNIIDIGAEDQMDYRKQNCDDEDTDDVDIKLEKTDICEDLSEAECADL